MAEEYGVIIPDEVFRIVRWFEDDLPAICVVNQSLDNFEPKTVFAWHLSIVIDCKNLANNGMPTPNEKDILDRISKHFDENIKVDSNALFLARITWNGAQELLYRVCNPEITNDFLVNISNSNKNIREFEFRIDHDRDWKLAEYFLHPHTASDSAH